MVLEAFAGPPPTPKHVANHINGNKLDNRAENLEWVTQSENVLHAYRTGLKKKFHGTANHHTKLTEEKVIEILQMVADRVDQDTIRKKFQVSQETVSAIVNGRRWVHVPRPPNLADRVKFGSDKLSDQQVREIRELRASTKLSFRQIAARYGVTEGTIRAVVKGKTWKHIN